MNNPKIVLSSTPAKSNGSQLVGGFITMHANSDESQQNTNDTNGVGALVGGLVTSPTDSQESQQAKNQIILNDGTIAFGEGSNVTIEAKSISGNGTIMIEGEGGTLIINVTDGIDGDLTIINDGGTICINAGSISTDTGLTTGNAVITENWQENVAGFIGVQASTTDFQ
jgi:hypothetical protein